MIIKTTRRDMIAGVAVGAVAVTVAPLPVSAAVPDTELTPQEQWEACIEEAVRLMKKGSALCRQYKGRIRTGYDDLRPELHGD